MRFTIPHLEQSAAFYVNQLSTWLDTYIPQSIKYEATSMYNQVWVNLYPGDYYSTVTGLKVSAAQEDFFLEAQQETGYQEYRQWHTEITTEIHRLKAQLLKGKKRPADLRAYLAGNLEQWQLKIVSPLSYQKLLAKLKIPLAKSTLTSFYRAIIEEAEENLRKVLAEQPEAALNYFYNDVNYHLIEIVGKRYSPQKLIAQLAFYQGLVPQALYHQVIKHVEAWLALEEHHKTLEYPSSYSVEESMWEKPCKETFLALNALFEPYFSGPPSTDLSLVDNTEQNDSALAPLIKGLVGRGKQLIRYVYQHPLYALTAGLVVQATAAAASPPRVVNPIPDQTFTVGQKVTIDLSSVFQAGNGTFLFAPTAQLSNGQPLPNWLSQVSLPPLLIGQYSLLGAQGVTFSRNYALAAAYNNGLQIINLANVTAPTLAGQYSLPDARGVTVSGNYAFVAAQDKGLQIINLANVTAPTLAGNYSLPFAVGVTVSGNYALVADRNIGLQIINLANMTAPTLAGQYSLPGGGADVVTVSGNYAFVAAGIASGGLQIINLANVTAPTLVGNYSLPFVADVTVSGNYAFVTAGGKGLQIINIANVTAPTLAGQYSLPNAVGVTVSGNYALVADQNIGLQIINIANVAAPTLAGQYSLPYAYGVAVSGNYAFVTDQNGLQIIDYKRQKLIGTALPGSQGMYAINVMATDSLGASVMDTFVLTILPTSTATDSMGANTSNQLPNIVGAIAGSLAGAVILLSGGIVAYYWYRKHQRTLGPAPVITPTIVELNSISPEIKKVVFDDLEKIGEGSFGIVYKGMWKRTAIESIPVALKTLKDQLEEFSKETSIMENIIHENIVRFFGIHDLEINNIMTKAIVTELMTEGSVDVFLKKHSKQSLTPLDILSMAINAAIGMRYLHENNIIHRDLAARNLLLTWHKNKYIVKVSDFGLSRKLDATNEENYYEVTSRNPVRWSAPECFLKQQVSIKSDLWSFGVVLYELFNFCKLLPYEEMSSRAVLNKILAGEVMYQYLQIADCPQGIQELLNECMNNESSHRPLFNKIIAKLENIQNVVVENNTWNNADSEASHVTAIGFDSKDYKKSPAEGDNNYAKAAITKSAFFNQTRSAARSTQDIRSVPESERKPNSGEEDYLQSFRPRT